MKRQSSLTDWVAPLVGLAVGNVFDVDGYDIESVVLTALSQCALYATKAEVVSTDSNPSVPRGTDETRFLSSVRNFVLQTKPTLESNFARKFNLSGQSAGNEIDFLGSRYATCYAAINPKIKARIRVTNASAALWKLARARDAFGFASPECIELTAWTPPEGLPIYTAAEYESVNEVVYELTAQAKREELRVFAASDARKASSRLLEVEVAKTLT